jgi:predicted ATPase/class 3 adenylate cyclase
MVGGNSLVSASMDLKRQLAAVMFTDIEGFTALMQTDESAAIAGRDKYVAVLERYHGAFGGEIVQFFGDGSLSRFANSVDAVDCAVAIQRDLRADPEVPVRIGIHVGNVMVEPTGLIGDAVNIASRIESFGLHGAVLISDSVEDQVRNQAGLSLVDLGKFKLKNVGRPFTIFAVDAPGLRVPAHDFLQGKGEKLASLPSNLPERSVPLLGRETVINDLAALLHQYRLVTITGPGGIGKTSTAVELCRHMVPEFLDGISFVPMAEVTEPENVLPTIARVLDVKEKEERSVEEGILSLISDKKALLMLDNLEQVVEAAPRIGDLLTGSPNLSLIVTSRAPLRISAEYEYRLDPLTLPPRDAPMGMEDLNDYAAVRLFVERARSVNPSFEITAENAADVVEICRRLDGLPLAIELAAPRVRILTADALLDRLSHTLDVLTAGPRDLPRRQQTLRRAIDWSHSLLDDAEKRLFRRLSVFVGGATIDDIQSVAADQDGDVVNELESLVEKALVAINGSRFSMLQTVREFAAESLDAAGEVREITRRYAEHYAGVAGSVREGVDGTEQLSWMERGVTEEPNLLAALDHLYALAKKGDDTAAELGATAVGDLWLYWHIRGKHLSARDYARDFLALVQGPSRGRARALITAGLASLTLANPAGAIEELLEAHAIGVELDDSYVVIAALVCLVVSSMMLGSERAGEYAIEGMARLEGEDFPMLRGLMLAFDGIFHFAAGDSEGALSRYEEALAIQQRRGDHEGAGVSLAAMAALAGSQGETAKALELYRSAQSSFEKVGDRAEEARVLGEMAWTFLAAGDTPSARQSFLASADAHQDVGSLPGLGNSLVGLASVASATGIPETAVALAAAADKLLGEEGVVVAYWEDSPGRPHLEAAEAALTPDQISRAKAEGVALSIGDVLRLARSDQTPTRD